MLHLHEDEFLRISSFFFFTRRHFVFADLFCFRNIWYGSTLDLRTLSLNVPVVY